MEKGLVDRPGRTLLLSSFLLLLSLTLVSDSYAVSVGVSPGTLIFEDVLKAGYSEKSIVISTSSTESVDCIVTAEKDGEAWDWITFLPGDRFTINPRSIYKLNVAVRPNESAPNGVYAGYLKVSLIPRSSQGGSLGSSIIAAVGVKVSVEVSDVETKHYNVLDVRVKDTEERTPIEFSMNLENDGNARVNPLIHIDILSEDKMDVVHSLDYPLEEPLLPTTNQEITIKVPNSLIIGKYWAQVLAYLDGEIVKEDLLVFEVLEKGSLRTQGQLAQIELNKIWVYAGEIVEVKAVFDNQGVLSTPAKLKAKAVLNDSVVAVFESDEVDIAAGKRGELLAYFTPEKDGRYLITGRVYYSKKVTEEKSSILNVMPLQKAAPVIGNVVAEEDDLLEKNLPLIAGIIIAVVAVGAAVVSVRKKRGPYVEIVEKDEDFLAEAIRGKKR